jgi:DNA polymerase I
VPTEYLASIDASYTWGPASDLAPALTSMLRRHGRALSVDIETYGLGADARRIKCVTFGTPDQAVVCDPRQTDIHRLVRSIPARASRLVFHNAAFDVPNLYANRLLALADITKVWDTMVWARLAWPDITIKNDLESCGVRLLGLDKRETMAKVARRHGITLAQFYANTDLDSPLYLMGAAIDAVVTARIAEPVRDAAMLTLTSGHPFTRWGVTNGEADRLVDREQQINRMLLPRACKGLRTDPDALEQYRAETATDKLRAQLTMQQAGISISDKGAPSATELLAYLQLEDALPADHPRTAKTGALSTRAAHLEALDHPVAGVFVAYKRICKIEDDYLGKVTNTAVDGRIHPAVNLLVATTGRMSYSGVPLHQFTGAARGIILADQGDALASLDWAQIEPVIAANIAGDTRVLAGYEAGTSDLYTDLATFAGITRKHAKTTLLAQLYGEGLAALAAGLGTDLDGARRTKQMIFRSLPKTAALLAKLREIGERYRRVFTLSGRILTVPMGRGSPPAVATHKAVNYFVQGSAYDLLAETLVAVDDAGLAEALYLTMHDEIVCSADAAPDIRKIMETPPERLCALAGRTPVLRTDLAVLGERWNDA